MIGLWLLLIGRPPPRMPKRPPGVTDDEWDAEGDRRATEWRERGEHSEGMIHEREDDGC